MAGRPPGVCYEKIKSPPFYLNFGFYSVSATLKWVRHGEKEDRTGLIQVGAVLVNASWNLCQGHGKGQWPNLFFCSQSTSYAPGRGEKKAQLWGSAVALWIKSSVSSSKPSCRKPLLFYSYECDEPSNLTAATAIDPSEKIGCTVDWGSVRRLGTTKCLFSNLLSQCIIHIWTWPDLCKREHLGRATQWKHLSILEDFACAWPDEVRKNL